LTAEVPARRDDLGPDPAEALSGRRAPFWKAAGGRRSTGTSHSRIPVELQTICERAAAPDPSARYESWAQLIADVRKFPGIKRPDWLNRARGKSAPDQS
jgi:hypothetical protein